MAETTADVRRDIELTRERMSTTLQQLEQKLNIMQVVRDNPWPALALAVGAGVLLILAISNLASLLMAWAAERQRETAVRLALGAQWLLPRSIGIAATPESASASQNRSSASRRSTGSFTMPPSPAVTSRS